MMVVIQGPTNVPQIKIFCYKFYTSHRTCGINVRKIEQQNISIDWKKQASTTNRTILLFKDNLIWVERKD